jgi:hypothetical protein
MIYTVRNTVVIITELRQKYDFFFITTGKALMVCMKCNPHRSGGISDLASDFHLPALEILQSSSL